MWLIAQDWDFDGDLDIVVDDILESDEFWPCINQQRPIHVLNPKSGSTLKGEGSPLPCQRESAA